MSALGATPCGIWSRLMGGTSENPTQISGVFLRPTPTAQWIPKSLGLGEANQKHMCENVCTVCSVLKSKPSFNLNTCNKEKLKQLGKERAERYFLWTLCLYTVKKNHRPLGFNSGQKQQVCRREESKHAPKAFCFLLLLSKTFQDETTTSVQDCFECFKRRVAYLMGSSMFRYETCVLLLWSTLFINEKEVYSTNYGLYSRK